MEIKKRGINLRRDKRKISLRRDKRKISLRRDKRKISLRRDKRKISLRRDKKGVFFSTDALIALSIVFITILIAYPIVISNKTKTELHYDVVNTLSNLQVGEVNDLYVQSLISSGQITDLNKTLLEQIGEFYVKNITIAKNMADSLLTNLDTNENIGIWYGNKLIASKNSTPYESALDVDLASQMISGIEEGKNITGFSARAFLSSSLQSNYIYFGGYVGDGNITINVPYIGNISSVLLEVAINNNFTVYVNGNLAGNYVKSSSETVPGSYIIPTTYFASGNNTLEIKGSNLHIAGGFLKVIYLADAQYQLPTRYNFPGIKGVINVYDGFYVPNQINSMNILLHYNSTQNIFLTIGNVTVFNGSSIGETNRTFNNSYLSSLLNYNLISNKTFPIRLGLQNQSYIAGGNAFIMSVVDLSGGVSSARSSGLSGVNAVKAANRLLVNSILGLNTTRVGLSGVWQGTVHGPYSHNLSNNETSLNNTINSWNNNGNLDLCYGILNATNILNSTGAASDFKAIVLLGTKFPNSCLGSSGNVYQDTYNLACRAWTNYSIHVNPIGIIGNSQSDANLNSLLYNISLCANGTYFNQSAVSNDIVQLYNSTVNSIINIVYNLQTASSAGNLFTSLYPDSYIEFNYTKAQPPIGIVLSLESQFVNSLGNFSIPNDSSILEANVVSYSGPLWTTLASVNNNNFYNLSKYGSNFINLGDPYYITIQLSYLNSSNVVNLSTGISQANSSSASN